MLKKLFIRAGIPAVTLSAAGSAFAVAPTTVTELASSVSFTDVGLAILAVAGVVITLYVVWKGAKFVLRAVKGA
jgi:hypothetical protein